MIRFVWFGVLLFTISLVQAKTLHVSTSDGFQTEVMPGSAPRRISLKLQGVLRVPLKLMAGELYPVSLKGSGLALTCNAYTADGTKLCHAGYLQATRGLFHIFVPALRDETVVLVIKAIATDGPGATATLTLETGMPITEAARQRFTAQVLAEQAEVGESSLESERQEKAYRCLQSASVLFGEASARCEQAQALVRLGDVCDAMHDSMGVPFFGEEARLYFGEALEILKSPNLGFDTRSEQGRILDRLGWAAFRVGNKLEALDKYISARALLEQAGANRDLANCLNDMGLIKESLREQESARKLYAEALALHKRCQNYGGAGTTYNNLGLSLLISKKDAWGSASAFRIAAKLRDKPQDRSQSLSNLALSYGLLHENEKAERVLKQALKLAEQGSRMELNTIRIQLANFYLGLGKYNDAKELCTRVVSEVTGVRANPGLQSYAKGILLQVARREGREDEALTYALEVMESSEDARVAAGSSESTVKYFSTKADSYDAVIDLLLNGRLKKAMAGRDSIALDVAELTKARRLGEALVDASATNPGTYLRPPLPPAVYELSGQINWKDSPDSDNQRVKRQRLYEAIKASEAASAAPNNSPILSQSDLLGRWSERAQRRKESLPPETALVVYHLGDERAYAWVVTNSSETVFDLGPTKEVRQHASGLSSLLATMSLGRSDDSIRHQFNIESARLGEMILPRKLRVQLPRSIVFVPDGELEGIPFAALVVSSTISGPEYLVDQHDLSYAPSVAVYMNLRQRPTVNTVNNLILTNPRYSLGASTDVADFTSLTSSDDERATFLSLIDPGLTEDLHGIQATKKNLLKFLATDHGIVHLACHAIAENDPPEFSYLALAKYGDNGPETDRYLLAFELVRLNIQARLVVLSACETGKGEFVRGEGVLSLTRAFMAAGARGIVASLWSIRGKPTAQLMDYFYYALLVEKRNIAAALCEAERKLRHDPEGSLPSYWAGFFLQGLSN